MDDARVAHAARPAAPQPALRPRPVLAIDAQTLKPSHCEPQPSLPVLLRMGHTPVGAAPVLVPWPCGHSLWLRPSDALDPEAARAAALALAQNWALQLLLQAPEALLSLHVFDPGLACSLPVLEALAAAANTHELPQRVHFITDVVSLHETLGAWRDQALLRKTQLLESGRPDWASLLRAQGGEPYHCLLLAGLDEVVTAEWASQRFPALIHQGPRLGFGFLVVGHGEPPAHVVHALDRTQWQTRFDAQFSPHLLRFDLSPGQVHWPAAWQKHATCVLYDEWGGVGLDGLAPGESDAVVASWLAHARRADADQRLPEDDWSVPIGTHQGEPFWFRIGRRWGCMHSLLAGQARSGKSALLSLLIARSCAQASVDEIQFTLFDLKPEPSFGPLEALPHVSRLCSQAGHPASALADLRDVLAEPSRREHRFHATMRQGDVKDFAGYNRLMRIRGRPSMPLRVVVIDDLQRLLAALAPAELREVLQGLAALARAGSRTGISLLVASTSFAAMDLPAPLRHLFRQRLCFTLDDVAECQALLDVGNTLPLRLAPRQLVVNGEFGRASANRVVQVDDLPPDGLFEAVRSAVVRHASFEPTAHGDTLGDTR